MLEKLMWYKKRLSVMSSQELLYRIHEYYVQKKLYLSYLSHAGVCSNKLFYCSDFRFSRSSTQCLPSLSWSRISEDEQKTISNGKHICFGKEWEWENIKGIWNISLENGNIWPLKYFDKIPYRQGNKIGDIRFVWEPSRLQQLVNLSLLVGYVNKKEAKNLTEDIVEQFNHWVDENPVLNGVHYVSSMECSLRILSVCVTFDNIRGEEIKDDVWETLLRFVWINASYVSKRISLYSSAGNHTIAECSGLLFAAILFPEFKESAKWQVQAETILFSEVTRQINSDGGGIEQALWYHVFVLDLFGLVIKLYEKYDMHIPDDLLNQHRTACTFINTFASSVDEIPNIGDSDNGYALSKYLNITWDERLYKEGLTVFKESGYSVYNRNTKGQQVIYCHGRLGMLPSCGHGHSDALSILVKSNNLPILIDSGTYTYTGDQRYREYFRSTRAHNTVVVDGLDQAAQEGPFLWSKAYTSSLIHHEVKGNGEISLVAKHEGYSRLGVIHWRGVQILSTGNILVIDVLTGEGEHDIELNWHTGSKATKVQSNEITLGKEMIKVVGGDVLLYSGEVSPVCGWYSPIYGIKQKSPVINVKYKGGLPHEFITEINLSGEFVPASIVKEKATLIRHVIDGCG